MTTHALNAVSVPVPVRTAVSATRLIETRVLRRCAQYRKAFRAAAISYPADALRLGQVAQWIRRHRVTLDVRSAEDLRQAGMAGVPVSQLVVQCAGMDAPLLRCAVNIGAGRFVVDSAEQVSALESAMGRMRHVVVDDAAPDVEQLVAKIMESRRLNLIGLHHRLNGDGETTADAVRAMVIRMSRLRREHPAVLTRVSLANFDAGSDVGRDTLRRHAEVIEDAIEDACIWFRYPRPALTLAPSRVALELDS